MKRILGLDLGTNSIGWALVNEAESDNEQSSIIKIGTRVIQYDNFVNTINGSESKNPINDFKSGKGISPNAGRTSKRSARRNLQRYKLRRENLISVLKENHIITDGCILSENDNHSTFETYRLRANAATQQVTLHQLSRILLMINKKRGYKSSRKVNVNEEGQLIDGLQIARMLYEMDLTPGQYVYNHLKEGKKKIPDFYRSDLQSEFDKIWNHQKQFYPEILTEDFKKQIESKSKQNTSKIFLGKYNIYTAKNEGSNKTTEAYSWRVNALNKRLDIDKVAFVISELNGIISKSSGYLGSISDRSKELYFSKQTVGQYLMNQLSMYPNTSLKNKIFYRQDYLDEFNTIWETQAKYYDLLTPELKKEIRDIIIFYQRKLKSQKSLINFCEFEQKQIEIKVEGKSKIVTTGLRACPRSSFLFQEFKIWQNLNNIEIHDKQNFTTYPLIQEEKELLFEELSIKEKLTPKEVLELLYSKKSKDYEINFKEKIEGNKTMAVLYKAYSKIIETSGHGEYDFTKLSAKEIQNIVSSIFNAMEFNTSILKFDSGLEEDALEKQASYQLWHLLYSYEGDNSITGNERLIEKICSRYGFTREYAAIIAGVTFQDDYGSLSTKAIRKILPYLKEGNGYDVACLYAGYKHSKNSLTREELEKKNYSPRLAALPKNALRNPVVEKILNQMVNVVNAVIEKYGNFSPLRDEIRIELARELKKNAKERESMTTMMNETAIKHEQYKQVLKDNFGLTNVSRKDLVRYKLYLELKDNGYKTLYSNTYIAPDKLFSKEFDIEHIIPESRLFDDSLSNKTLELRSVNIKKGNATAYDFILSEYGEENLETYIKRLDVLYKNNSLSKTKLNKLKMKGENIPDDFIARDLRDTQYIAKKAKDILSELVKTVVSTTGSITDRLREDWQLIDVMKELNWDKYDKLGLTETIVNRDNQKIKHIKDWTKRNDHRHHAMDALTIAFTKQSYVQYLNNLNARPNKKTSDIYGIETKELYRNKNKLVFKPPMPLDVFRAEAKRQLENTLVSIKSKNKVTTRNINKINVPGGYKKNVQLTPRGQLHNDTLYGCIQRLNIKEEKIGTNFNEQKIETVVKLQYRIALIERLKIYNNDPKLAFTGNNSLNINHIYLDHLHTKFVPEKVKTYFYETIYTIRKDISPDLKIDKVIDLKIKKILEDRLEEYGGDAKKAFSNLEENPIWLNKEKGISIKRVTLTAINNAVALHDKKDKDGNLVLDSDGKKMPVDFVSTGNNHHVAIFQDSEGNIQDEVVSFYEAVQKVNQDLPVINKSFDKSNDWEFLFSMKQNEYFVFPNPITKFDPNEIDLMDPENNALISPNLFRLQKFSKVKSKNSFVRDYVFRHHLESLLNDDITLKDVTYKQFKSIGFAGSIVKVRINHLGEIVHVGE